MTRDFQAELKQLQKTFSTAKNEEIRLQTRFEEAKKRRKEAHDKIKDEGYDVKTLPKIIAEKEEELAATIDEIKTYLPGDDKSDEDDDMYD